MNKQVVTFNAELLSKFFPLNGIQERYISQLSQTSLPTSKAKGETIIKSGSDDAFNHFLISGTIEVRKSFDERYEFNADDERAKFAIEECLVKGGTIKAKTPCKLLAVSTSTVDQLLAWSQEYNYEILHSHDMLTVIDDAVIDDSFSEDWSHEFIHKPLAANLSASELHHLFNALEEVPYEDGEVIIQQNTEADYFYIVQEGYAEVITDKLGPYAGESFELGPGCYFGDEAIIADTLRNATVIMTSAGKLGRLPRKEFESIVKGAVVKLQTDIEVQATPSACQQFIDVRLPFECSNSKNVNTENIPISHLRKQLRSFDDSKVYYIKPEGGRRSELAAYLMRQAGYEAYCLTA